MLAELSTELVFHFLLIFARMGSAIMLIPGIGETYVAPRVRLHFALGVTAVMVLPLHDMLPQPPGAPLAVFILIAAEVLTGLFIGGMTRLLLGIIHTVGMIIAFQSSLASAMFFDPSQGSQGSAIGNFLTVTAITLIFASNMHHLIIGAIADSYMKFPPGMFPPVHDFAQFAARLVSSGFEMALMISAPVAVVGFFLYFSAGIMARLMPNMQVFFVLIPAQIGITFIVMMLTLSAGMMAYLEYFQNTMMTFTQGG